VNVSGTPAAMFGRAGTVSILATALKDLKTIPSSSRDNLTEFASIFHRVTDEKSIQSNYRKLYLEERGYFIVSASQFGQRAKAWTETGPEFTRQLDFYLHLMETNKTMLNGRSALGTWHLFFMGICTSPLWDRDGERQQGQWSWVDPGDKAKLD
jgi:hypothetical protein